jgi:hypothetical protein
MPPALRSPGPVAPEVDPVAKILQPPPGDERVLDLACGSGRDSLEPRRRSFEIVGADISSDSRPEPQRRGDRLSRVRRGEPPQLDGRTGRAPLELEGERMEGPMIATRFGVVLEDLADRIQPAPPRCREHARSTSRWHGGRLIGDPSAELFGRIPVSAAWGLACDGSFDGPRPSTKRPTWPVWVPECIDKPICTTSLDRRDGAQSKKGEELMLRSATPGTTRTCSCRSLRPRRSRVGRAVVGG